MTIYTLEESKNIWLYSDPHFGHNNIIKYCNRPFANVNDMNETLLNNYKKVINDKSLVYFLGDISFGRQERKEQIPKWWVEQLPGNIVTYIKGSHDHGIRPTMASYPKNVQKVLLVDYIQVEGIIFCLTHEPVYVVMEDDPKFDWNIHGHVHNNRSMWNTIKKSINVSVEVTSYSPVLLYDIISIIRKAC